METTEQALVAGADFFMAKPFSATALREAVAARGGGQVRLRLV